MKKLGLLLFFLFFSTTYASDFCTFVVGSKIISEDGEFLGTLNSDEYDLDSIANEYGTYGSKYNSESIFNEYGTYGSKYNSYSPWNKYSSEGPRVFNGEYYLGRLSLNKYDADSLNPFLVLSCFIDTDDTRLDSFWDLYDDTFSDTKILTNSIDTNNCGINSSLDSDNKCYCNDGYIWEDINDQANYNCIQKSQCLDLDNGFLGGDNKCYCDVGYVWSEDRNKCIIEKMPTESCQDTYGIYSFSNGEKNSNGIYSCFCKEGYTWNGEGTLCIKKVVKTATEICIDSFGLNSYSDGTIGDSGGYNCLCKKGYEWGKNMNFCQKIENTDFLKDNYKSTFSQKLGTKLQKFPIKSLNTLVTQINKYLVKDNLKEDLRAKLEALLELIEEEIETR